MTVLNHRKVISSLAWVSFLFSVGQVLAAPPVVEIIAMPHPPVKAALSPLRDWLAAQGQKITVKEIDSESTDGLKRLKSVGMSGHIQVLILIDGQYRAKRKDGSTVEFERVELHVEINFQGMSMPPPPPQP